MEEMTGTVGLNGAEEQLPPEVCEEQAEMTGAAEAPEMTEAPAEEPPVKVEGVRPAEGMPLPERVMEGMTLRERARFFREDPEGYRRARNVF